MPATPKFFLLDDHALVRDGIEWQLHSDFPECHIVYSGDSLIDALAAVSAFAVRDIPVVVVSAMARPDVLQAELTAGVQTFIAKHSNLGHFSKAVRTVLDGGTWIPPDLAGAVLRAQSNVDLSAQEKRAQVLYASGLTLEMVARRMEITPNTVKHYLDRVRDKYTEAGIAARTKVQLHRVARMEGLLP